MLFTYVIQKSLNAAHIIARGDGTGGKVCRVEFEERQPTDTRILVYLWR